MPTKFRRRWKMLLILVVAIPAMTYAAAPEWTEDCLEEIRDYSENRQIIDSAKDRDCEMKEGLELVKNRISQKEGILDRLEAGAITLPEAGDLFLAMDRENEYVLTQNYRPGSFAECAQSRVIRFLFIRANSAQGKTETRYQQILPRLNREFEARFGYTIPME